MVDKKGKLFGKISVIDILVFIIIVGIMAGTFYRFVYLKDVGAGGDTKIQYTLKITGVRDFTFDYYTKEENLQCFDKKTGQKIGEIQSVRKEPYFEETKLNDGTVALKEKPGIIVVYVDIVSDGTQTQSAYFANGTYEIKVGSEISLNTKYVDVIGKVYQIQQ